MDENDHSVLATKLRELLDCHPVTGEKTTNKALGEAIGTRGQSVSLYRLGQTQPSPDLLLKIAQYFGVSVDYLLTGVSSTNTAIHSDLGLSEEAIEGLRNLTKGQHDMHGASTMRVLGIVNSLLADDATYSFLGMFANLVDQLLAASEEPIGRDDTAKFVLWQLGTYIQRFTTYRLAINHIDSAALQADAPFYQPAPPQGFPPPPANSPAAQMAKRDTPSS